MSLQSKVAAWSLWVLLLVPLAAGQTYNITDLGTLGGNFSQAWAINDFGAVVGYSCPDSACSILHAFLWTASGGMQDLGTLPGGGAYSFGGGINNFAQVAGSSDFSQPFMGDTHAFRLTRGSGIEDLGTLGCTFAGANGISLLGQIVGTGTVAPCDGGGQLRAFLWSQGNGMQDLGTLAGGTFSLGNAVNIFGQAVGYSDCFGCSGYHAFLWSSGGGMQDLGTLAGGTTSAAVGMNDYGTVVGTSDSASSGFQTNAFIWTKAEQMQDLGILPGGIWSAANAINDFNLIVGDSDFFTSPTHAFFRTRTGGAVSSGSHAFLWGPNLGLLDLNNLIPQQCVAGNCGWVLVNAQAINARGEIAGWGTIEGNTHAFLLTPRHSAQ